MDRFDHGWEGDDGNKNSMLSKSFVMVWFYQLFSVFPQCFYSFHSLCLLLLLRHSPQFSVSCSDTESTSFRFLPSLSITYTARIQFKNLFVALWYSWHWSISNPTHRRVIRPEILRAGASEKCLSNIDHTLTTLYATE